MRYRMSLQKIIDHDGSCYGVLCEDCPFTCTYGHRPHASQGAVLLENAKLQLIQLKLDEMLGRRDER